MVTIILLYHSCNHINLRLYIENQYLLLPGSVNVDFHVVYEEKKILIFECNMNYCYDKKTLKDVESN